MLPGGLRYVFGHPPDSGTPGFPKKTFKKPFFDNFLMAPKNPQKTFKKPSAAPEILKNPQKTLPGDMFEGFGQENKPKGARAQARAPPFGGF